MESHKGPQTASQPICTQRSHEASEGSLTQTEYENYDNWSDRRHHIGSSMRMADSAAPCPNALFMMSASNGQECCVKRKLKLRRKRQPGHVNRAPMRTARSWTTSTRSGQAARQPASPPVRQSAIYKADPGSDKIAAAALLAMCALLPISLNRKSAESSMI